MSRLKRLIHEVHRRSLWQVLAIFVASGWVVLQVVDMFVERGVAPEWAFTASFFLLLAGLPIVLATAFVQEGHPGKAGSGAAESEAREADAGADRSQSTEPLAAPDDADVAAPVAGVDAATGAATRDRSRSDSDRPTLAERLTWNRALLAGVLAFALLGVVATGYMAMRTLGIGAPGTLVAKGVLEEGARVVLADFQGADEELGDVVTEALRIDLFQSPTIRVLERADLADALERMERDPGEPITAEVATQIAEREGYAAVIAGDVGTAGSGYVLTARILGGEEWRSLAAFRQTARSNDHLIGAIERLSRDIRDKAGESLRTVQSGPSLARVTTSSLPALRAYTRGLEFEERGDLESSLEQYERAAALDSTFAMAHRKIAVTLVNMGTRFGDQVTAATRAYRFRERLPDHERYLAEAFYHDNVSGDADAAIRAYEQAIETDSTLQAALNNVGNLYRHRGRLEDAGEMYERALAAGAYSVGFTNLAETRFWQGRYEEASAVLDSAETAFPASGGVRLRQVQHAGSHQEWARFDSLLRVFDGVAEAELDRDLARWVRAQGAAVRGRLDEAEAALADLESAAFSNPFFLAAERASLDLQRADTAAAVDMIREAFDAHADSLAAQERWNRGVIYVLAEAGAERMAREAFEQWRAEVPEDELGVDGRRGRAEARAWVAWADGVPEEAIAILEDLRRECPGTCALQSSYGLARAHEAAGDTAAAIEEYEKHLEVRDPRRVWSGVRYLPTALERLARLHDARGNLEDAARYYAQFVELWKDADPELQPRVEAAQERLEEIVAERG